MTDTNQRTAAAYGPFPGPTLWPQNEFEPFPAEDVDKGIPHRIEKMAALYPDRLALKDDAEALTYDEMNRRVNRLAALILERDADRRRPVAVCLEHGNAAVLAVFAALKAGRVYMSLDTAYPRARVDYLLQDSGAALCLTSPVKAPALMPLLPEGFPVLDITQAGPDLPDGNPAVAIAPDDPATITYTSGSTGQPKGVLTTHRGVLRGKMVSINTHRLCKEDRVAQLASFSFAAAPSYFMSPLFVGAACLPFDIRTHGLGALADWLQRERITMFHLVPSVFRSFATLVEGRRFPDVRMFCLGGETVLPHDLELFQRCFSPGCLLRLTMSMTEAGCAISQIYFTTDSPVPRDVMPCGYDAEGVEVLLWDEEDRDVGRGRVGEIVVRSPHLPPGYWGKPELTARTYQPDPAGSDARIYRTGDLALRTPEGCLVHMGRKDFQVKVRGMRIETGEVETALLALDGVANAVVVARPDGSGQQRLVAYLAVGEGAPHPAVGDVRAWLEQRLPAYAVPSAFVVMDSLPLTPNGKVDRRALPEPEEALAPASTEYVPPRDMVERQLALIWQELLRVPRVGARDNFFELGGHSLLAGRLFMLIEEVYGRKLPLSTLVESPTLEALAAAVRSEDWEKALSPIVPVKATGSRTPFFCVAAMDAFAYVNLARLLDEEQPLYVLHPLGLLGGDDDGLDVPALAARYVGLVRQVQPRGPYLLGGMCSGGVTAFEMAQQLAGQGERIELLALIDTPHFTRRTPLQRARWVAGRAAYHLHQAWQQPWLRRPGYLLAKAGGVRRRLLPGGRRRPPAEGEAAVVEAYWQPIRDAYREPLFAYEPRPYPGRLHLFIGDSTPMGPYLDPRMRWRALAADGADVRVVPGNHTDMLREPNVSVLARELNDCLRRAADDAAVGGRELTS